MYTIMAFIISSFIHFILDFRDWCKDHYSKLVVHSQFKVTLSPVMVLAFLSQSIYLLTNHSNCRLYILVLSLSNIHTCSNSWKKHKLHHNHAFKPKSIHTPIFTKDKSVSLHNHQNQVKLFYMLQDEQTNYL